MGLVNGKIALGTGASRGIGRGIAHALGAQRATGIVTALWWGYVIIALIMLMAGCAANLEGPAAPETTVGDPSAPPPQSLEVPDAHERGPERPGEGQGDTGGHKYRSINSFALKHYSYLLGIKRKIEKVFSVPFFRLTNGAVGVPIVGCTIRRNGELAEAVLLHSSGYAVMDKALLEAVKRAAPYEPFPEHLPDSEISIRVYATVS